MKYITVYRTTDITEVSGIKEIFVRESINFKILNPETAANENKDVESSESSIQVEEQQQERANRILTQHGYASASGETPFKTTHRSRLPDSRDKPMINKWVILILVGLVVLIAIILFTWFMIP